MNNDLAEHLRKLSSRNGRYWLRDTRNATADSASKEELPFHSVLSKQEPSSQRATGHESVVVSIPNVEPQPVRPAPKIPAASVPAAAGLGPGSTASQAGRKTKVVASLPKLHPVPPAPHKPVAKAPNQTPVAAGDERATAARTETPDPHLQLKELRSRPSAASEGVSDDAVAASRAHLNHANKDSIATIADEVMEKYPAASPSVIMIAGSQASFHVDETCARVAAELAGRELGRVLLIDSDFEGRRLTKASGMLKQGGLSEIMNIAFPWHDAILKSGSSRLDFMAAGNCPHKRWTPKATLREALAEMKSEYQFICVSVGDAHSSAATTWSELADGALLVVSAATSSEEVAESAVLQLRNGGARLFGCIAADVPARAA